MKKQRFMRYWLDTEFLEDGKTIELISIGIVSNDGREYYAENSEFDPARATDWLNENVMPHLIGGEASKPRQQIAEEIYQFCHPETYGRPNFWGYYADYDWVVFCWLWGRMIDKPDGFPMFCNDIKQWCEARGNPRLPEQTTTAHNALEDARWNKQAFEFLCALPPKNRQTGTVKMTTDVMRQLAEQQKHKGEPRKPERFLLETPYDLPDGSPVTELNYLKSDTTWRAVDGEGNKYTLEPGGKWVKVNPSS